MSGEIGRHRATYTLELGAWLATCKVCGHRVSDRHRQQAASKFRVHIRATTIASAGIIDLRPEPTGLGRGLPAGETEVMPAPSLRC